jgi:hypothetical protein
LIILDQDDATTDFEVLYEKNKHVKTFEEGALMDQVVAQAVHCVQELVDLHFRKLFDQLEKLAFVSFLNLLHNDSLFNNKFLCFLLHLYHDLSLLHFDLVLFVHRPIIIVYRRVGIFNFNFGNSFTAARSSL